MNKKQLIPKHIVQVWHSSDIPKVAVKNIEKIKQMNPEYIHTTFNEEEIDNFVNSNYPGDIAECYNKINIIASKVDFWRYLYLYKNGGVYLDMDSTIKKPLREIINETDQALLSMESNPGIMLQWFLIFTANHPILEKTIEIVVRNIKNNLFLNDMMNSTVKPFTQGFEYVHKNLFKTELPLKDKNYNKNNFSEYSKNNISYRFYGIDFNGDALWKFEGSNELYTGIKHWSIIENELKNKKII